IATYDLVSVSVQVVEQLKFFVRHLYFLVARLSLERVKVNVDISDGDHLIRSRFRGTASQYCLDTRKQFPYAEGFRYVIIRAKRKPEDLVNFLATCSQQD